MLLPLTRRRYPQALPVASDEPEATGRRRERAALPSLSARSSFTLIELLVVIAVISVLAAMLLPAMASAREKAKLQLCVNNFKQLGIATMLYADEYDAWAPNGSLAQASNSNATSDSYYRFCFYWRVRKTMFYDFGMNNWRYWYCPSALDRGISSDEGVHPSMARNSFMGAGSDTNGANNPSQTPYGYLGGKRGATNLDKDGNPKNDASPMERFGNYGNESERLLWMDAISFDGTAERYRGGLTYWFVPVNSHAYGGTHYIPKGGNYLMADGHVEWRDYVLGVNTVTLTGQSYSWKQ